MRLPWIQNHIVKNLSVEGDPLINSDKLIEFGASMSVKSPSKSVVYDWESSIFNRIKNREEFKKAIREVENLTSEVPDWGNVLFNRTEDDLFYGLLIEIWNEA